MTQQSEQATEQGITHQITQQIRQPLAQIRAQKRVLSAVFGLMGVAGTAYFLYRRLATQAQAIITPEVRSKLPVAKDLSTIPDQAGNYDIDGVSFDSEGVVVASDNHKEMESVLH